VNENFPPCAEFPPDLNLGEFNRFINDAHAAESSALIIVKDGCTVWEEHDAGNIDEEFSVQSVSKSIASLAIGTLIDQGRLRSLNQTLPSVFAGYKFESPKDQITIFNLLTHTSGYGDWNSLQRNGETLPSIFATPLKAEPGTEFIYSSMASYLIGPSIEALIGSSGVDYIRTHLFEPLEMHSAHFADDHLDTGGGVYMSSRDMLHIGQMMMDEGVWHGKQIVSKEWILKSVTSSQDLFHDYGLLWWLYPTNVGSKQPAEVFSAIGYEGQYIAVYPSARLMIIRTHRLEKDPTSDRMQTISFYDLPKRLKPLLKSFRSTRSSRTTAGIGPASL
jgi:CubicO group peptidase (beta-lactamase class C family)